MERMKNINVYNMGNAIKSSKYAMATDTNNVDNSITKTTLTLGNAKMSSGHNNYLKGILVSFDLTLPNKMWVEWERYIFAPIVTSQSTMHRICKLNLDELCNEYVWDSTKEKLKANIDIYNALEDKTTEEAKKLYLDILYNAPSGLELTAQVVTNYMSLKTIYNQRLGHRLPEWKDVLNQIEKLPYFKELCLNKDSEKVIGHKPTNHYEL